MSEETKRFWLYRVEDNLRVTKTELSKRPDFDWGMDDITEAYLVVPEGLSGHEAIIPIIKEQVDYLEASMKLFSVHV